MVYYWENNSQQKRSQEISEAERGPCSHPLLEKSEFMADNLFFLTDCINKFKRSDQGQRQIRSEVSEQQLWPVWQRGELGGYECSGWAKTTCESESQGEGLPGRTRCSAETPGSTREKVVLWGIMLVLLQTKPKGCFPFPVFFWVPRARDSLLFHCLTLLKPLVMRNLKGETCMWQGRSLQLPYILHADVSSVLPCFWSSCLRNTFR